MTNTMKKRLNKVKAFFSQPANIILVVFLLVLAVTTIYPIISMILQSFTVSVRETIIYDQYNPGDFFVEGWKKLLKFDTFGKFRFYTPLLHSLVLSLVSSAVAIFIGGIFAFFICRTNVKFKGLISTLLIFPYVMPSWSIALFWRDFFVNDSFAKGGSYN